MVLTHHVADRIHEDFPWFGAFHRILSSRPKIIPPAIVTGVRPAGREIVYNSLPPPSQEHDPNINPTLYALGSHDATSPPLSSQPRMSAPLRYSVRSELPTPLFAQPGVSSQSVSQIPLSPSQREVAPATSKPRFATMLEKAKENVKIRPHKRSLEDTLSEGIS